ncbi:hypothetical protein CY35_07G044700 [Sphagnum magellanicum]|uniref:Uncharacterized protein n=1 Tax=Sphagnum magellanicum TaxID=128215 RepID=A0ACB8HLR4_9BRYO|nr:hypothetical protein CY35_07G044700 [Sphagnum magellanicum]
MKQDPSILAAWVGACGIHRLYFECDMNVLLSHVCAAAHMWNNSITVEEQGQCWIEMEWEMEAGYVPETCFCMHDLDKHQKEWTVCYHIEKLAIAYSFMSTVPEIPIYVFEELWHML